MLGSNPTGAEKTNTVGMWVRSINRHVIHHSRNCATFDEVEIMGTNQPAPRIGWLSMAAWRFFILRNGVSR